MTNSFLSSRRKSLRIFLIILLSIVGIYFAVDLSATLILNHQLNKAKKSFKEDAGISLNYTIAIFDILSGISINNLSITDDHNKIFDTGSINLKLNVLESVFKRRLSCKEILIFDSQIYRVDHLDKSYLSFLLRSAKDSQEMLKSTMIKLFNFNFMDLIKLDIGGYVALAQNKVLLSRGKIRILEAEFLGKTDIDQSNSLLDVPLDYAFDSTYIDGDFIINKLDLIGFSARLIISGRIDDYQDTFDLDLKGELKDFLLEDVKQLNNDYIYSRGILYSKFYVKGPIENSEFRIDINISNCSLKAMDFLKMNKISSSLVWDNKGFSSQKTTGLLGGSPFSLSLGIENVDDKKLINLDLEVKNLDVFEDVKINFQGQARENAFGGDIEIELKQTQNQKKLTNYFNFKNLYLAFEDSEFTCDSAEIRLSESIPGEAGQRVKNIDLKDLSAGMAIVGDSLEFYNLEAGAYGGILKGDASFKSINNTFHYNGKIILNNLNAADVVRDLLSDDYKLSGLLSGSVILNSKLRENITGDVQIINGKLEDNAVLTAISDFFGIPSLKSVAFSNLKIIFHKVWNQYDTKISLFSPDVSIYLDNKSLVGESLDGYLLVKLDTALTDESLRFKRLFKYIGYKEPTVYFPFQLKGYLGKPRIEWLENEFKEKLADFLPESNKQLLQDALNKMVEGFSE